MNYPEIFINVVTPLLFVVIGIVANRLGRRGNDDTPLLNYYAVGTSVFLMSLACILSDVHINTGGKLEGHFGWIAFYLVFVFVSIDVDRYSSWERDNQGMPKNKKRIWRGVIFPNALSVSAFCFFKFIV